MLFLRKRKELNINMKILIIIVIFLQISFVTNSFAANNSNVGYSPNYNTGYSSNYYTLYPNYQAQRPSSRNNYYNNKTPKKTYQQSSYKPKSYYNKKSRIKTKGDVVYVGGSFLKDTYTGFIGSSSALNRNIFSDGFAIKADASYTKYKYETLPENVTNKDGSAYNSSEEYTDINASLSSGSLMLSYKKIFGFNYISLSTGVDVSSYSADKVDLLSDTVDNEVGSKSQIDFALSSRYVSLSNSSYYNTAFKSYYSRSALDFHAGGVSFGPETIFVGNESFNQRKYGVSISNINMGPLNLFLSGGYAEVSSRYTSSSAYGTISISTIF